MKNKIKEEVLKKLSKKFIIDSKINIPKEVGEILVKRNVKTIKGGNPIFLGDFELLPKKKKEKVLLIAKKMYIFFDTKRSLFNMSDLITIKRLDEILEQKLNKSLRGGE